MNTKEKLTEIIGNVVVNDKGNRIRDVFHPEFVEKIVNNLIKHDAKTVVRCKDCLHYMEMEGCDYKGKKARHCFWHSQLRREIDYCSDGIRKGGEKMRERLIEIFKQADEKAFEYIRENDHMDFIPTKDEIAGVYADHLLANGVIVPPCKVGDTLYVISQMKDKRILPFVNEYEATYIQVGKRKCKVYHEKDGFIKIFLQDDFGKTVFLTREEAEAALKEKGE